MNGEAKTAVGILIHKSAGLLFTYAEPRARFRPSRIASLGIEPLETDDVSVSDQEGSDDDDDYDIDETLDRIANTLDRFAAFGAENDDAVLKLKERRTVLNEDVAKFGAQLPDDEDRSLTPEQEKQFETLRQLADGLESEVDNAIATILAKYAGSWANMARQAAEQEIAKLSPQLARLNKINASNPIPKVQKKLNDAVRSAVDIADDAERARNFEQIRKDAEEELRKCRQCKDAETAVNRAVVEMKLVFDQVSGFLPQAQVGGWARADPTRSAFNKAVDSVKTALGRAKDLDDLKQRLEAAVLEVNEAKVRIEAALADKRPLEDQKAAARAAIEAARQAISHIVADEVRSPLLERLNTLTERQAAVSDAADVTDTRKEFFEIGKAARALNDEARKALYTEQANTEEGSTKLDELIAAFGDKAADPMDQASCRAALAARFDLNVKIPDGLSVELLPRLYKLFQQLPEDHTVHDLMKNLEYGTETGDAHYYHEAGKRIVLLASLSEDVEQYYVCQETGVRETVQHFNATVLHEIGHGVDAKKGVTGEARMGKSGFGLWKKESLNSVIAAFYDGIFKKYTDSDEDATEADLKAMLTSLLTAGTCAKPASADGPLGSLFAKWDTISAEPAFAWCTTIRDGQQPWKKLNDVDGRVYQECYEDDWWSYDLGERKSTGISDYQWRARPEWFAEAYALYHLKKVRKFPNEIDEFVLGPQKQTK